ncbi:hypothetical protein BY458DRAFT_448092 [Sporodiniella umbellata]|nr:hypothetical protein BY458DRAFT_448092 [Sporodiniella umbellata]
MFSGVMEAIQGIPRDDLDLRLEALTTVNKLFKLDGSSRDAFKREGGFVSLVSMIIALEGTFGLSKENDSLAKTEDIQTKTLLLLQTIFSVLAESMYQHEINRQHFLKDVGYETLENAIALTGVFSQKWSAERMFGILFSFAVENEIMLDIFTAKEKKQEDHKQKYEQIESILNSSVIILANPEIMPVILHLQRLSMSHFLLSHSVLLVLLNLSQGSRGNQIKMNKSGLMLSLFERLFDKKLQGESEDKDILVSIIKNLMSMGISSKELRYMIKRLDLSSGKNSTEYLLDLALHGASGCRWPGFIQFSNPSDCLEIPQLADFPPPNPGYTILFWLNIEKQNDFSSLPLFNVWSDNQQVFRIFVDARSKMLLIQSSYSKQPVLFKGFEFQTGLWYHLVLVHNKSRLASRLSSVSMYDTIEKETISMFFNMGSRYRSLFQDSLEQFQTYEATTTLYLTLRNMAKGKRNDSSDKQLLNSILGGSAFQYIPESKFVFAFFANNVLADGNHNGMSLTGISTATRQMIVSEINNSRMVLNSAVPKLDTAVYRPKSMGYLVGEPVTAYPFGLDESIWKIGGCSVVLKLIESAQTASTLSKTTALLLETIRFSWRNSADMERCHGYEILAYILKQKRDLITLELFELLLVFIGKDPKNFENSIINNPLAYRYVVLNFEVWKKTSIDVQKAHLEQFILFLNKSNSRSFNTKRLSRIHLVKKLLLAFRMNIYAKELVSYVVHALKAVMLSNWDTEGIKAVATFLASTVAQGNV